MAVVDRDPNAPAEDPSPEDGVLFTVGYEGPFTLDEIDLIETWSGVPFPQWFDGQTFEGALRRAITCVKVRRADPDYPLSEAGAQWHIPADAED